MRKIAVIGGGVVGCAVAWHIAERGLGEVVLLERDMLGSGTTWHSAGNITWKPIADNDAPVLYMYEIIERLERETGQSTGWLQTSRLIIARENHGMADLEQQASTLTERGYETKVLNPAEAAALHPLLDPDAFAGAWHNPLSGRVNPADLVAAYTKAARKLGVEIRQNCRVTGVATRNGRVSHVETSDGPVEADDVVVCAGLWSRMLLEPLGVSLGQWGCEHFYVICDIEPRLSRDTPGFSSTADQIYGREETGGLLVGCFDDGAKTIDAADLPDPFAFSLLDEDWDKVYPYFEKAMQLFPVLRNAPVRKFLNGPEAFTPDGNAFVGPIDGIAGLHVCTGMNSHGVTISAAAGHVIADMLEGVEPRFETTLYEPGRFGDKARDKDWLIAQAAAAPSSYYKDVNKAR